MKKLFKNTILGIALFALSGVFASVFWASNIIEAKADGVESITLSDCYFSGSDYQNAANGTGLSVDNDASHWGKYDWTTNQNTVDLHFNAIVGTAESEFYVYLGNKQNEGGCIFLIQFQAAGLMTYAYSSLATFQNALRWDSLGFTGTTNEFYIHLTSVFDAENDKVNASIEAINLTRNSTNVKTRTVSNIALSSDFDTSYTFVRLFRRGSIHDITLYDHWNKITFVDGDDSNVRTVDRNSQIGTLPTPAGKQGAEFIGWFDDNGNEVSASTLSTRSMTVTAKYSQPRPFKGVTLRDTNFANEITLTGNGANIYGRYDIFAPVNENRLDFSFKIKFNDCIDNSTNNGPAFDVHFPNKQNDGTPKARIYFGKNNFSAYLCQGSWDGFVTTNTIKFNDTDTFLMNFVVTIDSSNISVSITATNLTTGAAGTLSRTYTMTNVPTSDYTYIRINNISDAGGVKATLTNAWDTPTTQYIKYHNGDDTSVIIADTGAVLTANQVTLDDTESQLFYHYVDENNDPVRAGYELNRDITLTAVFVDKNANGYAKLFIEKYLKPEIGTDDVGTGKCASEGWYNTAKAAFNALSLEVRTEFLTNSEFADAKARLVAWANANGDEIVNNQISQKVNLAIHVSGGNTSMLPIIIATIIGGFAISLAVCLLHKKRKQQ